MHRVLFGSVAKRGRIVIKIQDGLVLPLPYPCLAFALRYTICVCVCVGVLLLFCVCPNLPLIRLPALARRWLGWFVIMHITVDTMVQRACYCARRSFCSFALVRCGMQPHASSIYLSSPPPPLPPLFARVVLRLGGPIAPCRTRTRGQPVLPVQ